MKINITLGCDSKPNSSELAKLIKRRLARALTGELKPPSPPPPPTRVPRKKRKPPWPEPGAIDLLFREARRIR